jgi:hypothetical protein
MNITKLNNYQETLRKKKSHLITSCSYIKIIKLSTKRTFIEIYKYHIIDYEH